MKSTGGSDRAKRNAGEAAAEVIEDGMVVGLGTGSTAAHAIRKLGDRVDAGLDIVGVPTSFSARERARKHGIALVSLGAIDGIDIAIDGADQLVRASGDCIKGGGAAHAREKLVASAADELHIVVDPTKVVDTLDHTVAVEVLPAAHIVVAYALNDLGGDPTLRQAAHKDGPVVTDNGNLVLDCAFGQIPEPASLAAELSAIPGVLEHGLFVGETTVCYVGSDEGVEQSTY